MLAHSDFNVVFRSMISFIIYFPLCIPDLNKQEWVVFIIISLSVSWWRNVMASQDMRVGLRGKLTWMVLFSITLYAYDRTAMKTRIRDLVLIFALLFAHSGLAWPCLQTHWNMKLDRSSSMSVGMKQEDLGIHLLPWNLGLKCSLFPAFLMSLVQGPAAFHISYNAV